MFTPQLKTLSSSALPYHNLQPLYLVLKVIYSLSFINLSRLVSEDYLYLEDLIFTEFLSNVPYLQEALFLFDNMAIK